MRFSLQNIELSVYLGITEEEQSTPQTVRVSVSFTADTRAAEQSDNITDTADYQAVYDRIKSLAEGKWNLLEKLHADLLTALKEKFPELKNITLQIEKRPWEDGSVVIE